MVMICNINKKLKIKNKIQPDDSRQYSSLRTYFALAYGKGDVNIHNGMMIFVRIGHRNLVILTKKNTNSKQWLWFAMVITSNLKVDIINVDGH